MSRPGARLGRDERSHLHRRRVGQREPDELIRFVVGPDGAVVPDLKRNLPGRGCWVTADREHVDKACEEGPVRPSFQIGALKSEVTVPPDLGGMVDRLLAKSALGALGLARKAGAVALGAAKVEASVRSGAALLVLHAAEASQDGVRKIAQARRATAHAGGPEITAYKLFSEAGIGFGIGRHKCDTCCRSRGRRREERLKSAWLRLTATGAVLRTSRRCLRRLLTGMTAAEDME